MQGLTADYFEFFFAVNNDKWAWRLLPKTNSNVRGCLCVSKNFENKFLDLWLFQKNIFSGKFCGSCGSWAWNDSVYVIQKTTKFRSDIHLDKEKSEKLEKFLSNLEVKDFYGEVVSKFSGDQFIWSGLDFLLKSKSAREYFLKNKISIKMKSFGTQYSEDMKAIVTVDGNSFSREEKIERDMNTESWWHGVRCCIDAGIFEPFKFTIDGQAILYLRGEIATSFSLKEEQKMISFLKILQKNDFLEDVNPEDVIKTEMDENIKCLVVGNKKMPWKVV